MSEKYKLKKSILYFVSILSTVQYGSILTGLKCSFTSNFDTFEPNSRLNTIGLSIHLS